MRPGRHRWEAEETVELTNKEGVHLKQGCRRGDALQPRTLPPHFPCCHFSQSPPLVTDDEWIPTLPASPAASLSA